MVGKVGREKGEGQGGGQISEKGIRMCERREGEEGGLLRACISSTANGSTMG